MVAADPHGHDPHGAEAGASAVEHGDADHAAVDHGAPTDSHEQGAHQCQCLSHGCCTAAVTVPPAGQLVRWFAIVTRRADPPADAAHTAPRAPAPRFLPPATGPPGLA